MTEAFTLCVTGDLHLGRRPSRIPETLDKTTFSPRTVWQSTVDLAIDDDVDAVVVTGDVIDRENRYFEAYGAFEQGLSRLAGADIPVVAVAGNHDFDVLSRLARDVDIPTFTLLGADGDWERHTITDGDGHPLVHFDGWSFQSSHERTSPLKEYDPDAGEPGRPAAASDDAPIIGVLHADLDAADSSYAPVRTAALKETPPTAWLLGHIHAPGVILDRDPFVLYPGSPQPLDPGEPGQHGPWLVSLDENDTVTADHHPLATVRYDEIAVDVTDAVDAKAIPPLATDAIRTHVADDVDVTALELLLARVTVTGRTDAHRDLYAKRADLQADLHVTQSGVSIRVESLEIDTRPAVDLDALADGNTPAAYLARLLQALERETLDPDQQRLVEHAHDALRTARNASAYRELRQEERLPQPDETDARNALEREARRLLDELVTQQEPDP